MKTHTLLFIFAMIIALISKSQSYGEIKGSLLDSKTNKPIAFADVYINDNGKMISTLTDEKGVFTLKLLESGNYDLNFSIMGYNGKILTAVSVYSNKATYLFDTKLEEKENLIGTVTKVEIYTPPVLKKDEPQRMDILVPDIKNSAVGDNLPELLSTSCPGIKTNDYGQMFVRGTRSGSVIYVVDGVKIASDNVSVLSNTISSMQVYTGGIPSEYGDILGGVIVIETKTLKDYIREYNLRKASL